jgi:hypothetical protein
MKGGKAMGKNLLVFVLGHFCIHPYAFAAGTIKVGIIDTYSGPATSFTIDVHAPRGFRALPFPDPLPLPC